MKRVRAAVGNVDQLRNSVSWTSVKVPVPTQLTPAHVSIVYCFMCVSLRLCEGCVCRVIASMLECWRRYALSDNEMCLPVIICTLW